MPNGKLPSLEITRIAARAASLIGRHLQEVIEQLAYRLAKANADGIPDSVTPDDVFLAAQFIVSAVDPNFRFNQIKGSINQAIQEQPTSNAWDDLFEDAAQELNREIGPVVDDISKQREIVVHLQKNLAPMPDASFPKRPWVFISYAHGVNDEIVDEIVARLEEEKLNAFRDSASLEPGNDWVRTIGRGLLECKAVLAIISKKFLASPHCGSELICALMLGRQLVPVTLGIEADDLPTYLMPQQCTPLGSRKQLEKVVKRVKGLCER